MLTRGAGALALALVLASCSDGAEDEPSGGATSEPGSESGAATSSAPAPDGSATTAPPGAVVTFAPGVTVPEGPAGEQLTWVLDVLNGSDPEIAEIEERFDDAFRAQVPPEQMAPVWQQMRSGGPYTLTRVEGDTAVLAARLEAEDGTDLDVSVVADGDGVMSGLTFTPAAPEDAGAAAASTEEVVSALEGLGAAGQAQVLIARVQDGECVPVSEVDAETPGPIGSAFKLYVLATVVDAVDSGDLAWDDELTIDADLVSFPSGRLQEEPDGTTVTVQEAAELMISISDNTGTDLLVDALGPERIEASLTDLGVEDPSGMTPFPRTTEIFQVLWGGSDAAVAAHEEWADADDERQRELLDALPPGVGDIDPMTIDPVPQWQQDMDWLASNADLCRVHVALQERADTEAGAPVRDILSANTGLGSVPEGYDYLGFKGGSLIGAITFSWYGEPSAGDPVVVVARVQAQDTLDELDAVAAADDLLDLALTEEGEATP